MFRPAKPIMLPPKYVARDHKVPRMQPVVQPVVHVDRFHVVNVPKPIYKPMRKSVVVDRRPGFF